MHNKLKIIFWMVRNHYYRHLLYTLIFFLKKKFNNKIKVYETSSFKEANKICLNLVISQKELYLKLFNKKNYKIKKNFLKKKSNNNKYKMGGGSDTVLIYNLLLNLKPKDIIEFGVANGWSTIAILKACEKNKSGNLISIDMPYYFENAKLLIANLVDKKAYQNWKLLIGPQVNFFNQFKNKKFDFCHYDSDKSYQGRMYAYSKIWGSLKKKSVLLSDDISDNMAFFHFCKNISKTPHVIKFKKKYLGLIIK